jgi:hypothetical protein
LETLIKNDSIVFQPSDVLDLGLAHDPDFAVFFTESNQLSVRRRRKPQQQDPNEPVIAESSGEVTPTLNGEKTTDSSTNTAEQDATTAKARKADSDLMSIADHVAQEGFIADEEIETICRTLEVPTMSREIRRARFQEAEKYIKAKQRSVKA